LTISDTVKVYFYSDSKEIQQAVEVYSQEIQEEVLAEELIFSKVDELFTQKDVKINNELVSLGLEKTN
jgi:hypothetical protein